jgi:hypothetical protein
MVSFTTCAEKHEAYAPAYITEPTLALKLCLRSAALCQEGQSLEVTCVTDLLAWLSAEGPEGPQAPLFREGLAVQFSEAMQGAMCAPATCIYLLSKVFLTCATVCEEL